MRFTDSRLEPFASRSSRSAISSNGVEVLGDLVLVGVLMICFPLRLDRGEGRVRCRLGFISGFIRIFYPRMNADFGGARFCGRDARAAASGRRSATSLPRFAFSFRFNRGLISTRMRMSAGGHSGKIPAVDRLFGGDPVFYGARPSVPPVVESSPGANRSTGVGRSCDGDGYSWFGCWFSMGFWFAGWWRDIVIP
jgi:hypothetical protein